MAGGREIVEKEAANNCRTARRCHRRSSSIPTSQLPEFSSSLTLLDRLQFFNKSPFSVSPFSLVFSSSFLFFLSNESSVSRRKKKQNTFTLFNFAAPSAARKLLLGSFDIHSIDLYLFSITLLHRLIIYRVSDRVSGRREVWFNRLVRECGGWTRRGTGCNRFVVAELA